MSYLVSTHLRLRPRAFFSHILLTLELLLSMYMSSSHPPINFMQLNYGNPPTNLQKLIVKPLAITIIFLLMETLWPRFYKTGFVLITLYQTNY